MLTLQLPPVVVAAAAAPSVEKITPAALPPAVALEKPRSEAQALNGIAQQQATAADPAVGPQLPVSPSVVVDPGTSASPAVTAPILSATAPNLMQIVVTFGAPMSSHGATDVQDGAHYSLTSPGTSGLVIGAGQLATDGMTLTLTLSCAQSPCQKLSPGASYTLTLTGVASAGAPPTLYDTTSTTLTVPADVTLTISQPGAYTFVITSSEPLDENSANPTLWDGGPFPGRITLQGGSGTACDEGLSDSCLRRLRLTLNASPGLPAPLTTHTIYVSGWRDIAGRSVAPQTFTVTIPSDTTAPVATFANQPFFSTNTTAAPTTYVPIQRLNIDFSESMRVTNDGFVTAESANVASNYSITRDDSTPVLSPSGAPVSITGAFSKGGGPKTGQLNLKKFSGSRVSVDLSGLLVSGAYHLAIAGTLKDDAGNALGATSLAFTIGSGGAPTALNASSTATQLFVTFDKTVDASATHAADNASYTLGSPSLLTAAQEAQVRSALAGMHASTQGDAARAALYNDSQGFGQFGFDTTGVTFTYPAALSGIDSFPLHIEGVRDDFGNLMTPQDTTVNVTGATIAPSVSVVNPMQLKVAYPTAMSTTGARDMKDGAHYSLSGGLVVGGGEASADFRSVTLTLTCLTTPTCQMLTPGASYTLSVSGVADRTEAFFATGSASFTAPAADYLTLERIGAYTYVISSPQPLDPTTVSSITWDGAAFPGRVTLQGGPGTFCDTGIADSCMRRIRLAFNAASLPTAGAHTLGVHLRDIAGRAIVPTGSPDHFDVTISTDTTVPTATFGGAPVFGNPTTPTAPSFIVAQQVRIVFSTAMRSTLDGFDPAQAANTVGNYTLTRNDGSPALSRGGATVSITSVSYKTGGAQVNNPNLLRFNGLRAHLQLSDALAPGTYVISIVGSVSSDSGTPIGPTNVAFTVPADNALSVSQALSSPTQLYVTYGKDIEVTATHASDRASYTSTNPTLQALLSGMTATNQGNTARATLYNDANGFGPFSFDGTGVTFTYPGTLPAGTYTMTVGGVSDDFGNAMASQTVTFTVGGAAGPTRSDFTVGTTPHELVFDGNAMWVSNYGSATVSKLRASDGSLLGTFTVAAYPNAYPVALAFDGQNIWVVSQSGQITKFRASDGTNIGAFQIGDGYGLGATFDGSDIWLANELDKVGRFHTSDGTLFATYAMPSGSRPRNVLFAGGYIWVANSGSDSVSKLDPSTGAILATYSAGGQPFGLAFDGTNIWVGNQIGNNVVKVRATDGAIVATVPITQCHSAPCPRDIAFDGGNVWVAVEDSGSVAKIRASDATLLGYFAVGSQPAGIAFDGSGGTWVANRGSNTVTRLLAAAPARATLTVTLAGPGSGYVTSSPAGVTCPPTCNADFPVGTAVMLTQLANPSSSFSGWNQPGCLTFCAVSVDAPRSVTATYNTAPAGVAPAMTSCSALNATTVSCSFNESMSTDGSADINDVSHYTIDGGVTLGGAFTPTVDGQSVTLQLVCNPIGGAGTATGCSNTNHLAQGATYTVTAKGLRSASGTYASGLLSASFRVNDTTSPTASVTQIGAGTLRLLFSKPVDSGTLTPANVLWDGAPFPGHIAIASNGPQNCEFNDPPCNALVRLDFGPGGMTPGSHVLALNNIFDGVGNALGGTTTFPLTVDADTTPPTAILLRAADGLFAGRRVSRAQLQFSESMAYSPNGYSVLQSVDTLSNYALYNPDGSAATTGGASGIGDPITIVGPVRVGNNNVQQSRFELRRARLGFSAMLKPGVPYRLAVNNLTDEAANPLGPLTFALVWPGKSTPIAVQHVNATPTSLAIDFSDDILATADGDGSFNTHACVISSYHGSPEGSASALALNRWLATLGPGVIDNGLFADSCMFTQNGPDPTPFLPPGAYTLTIGGGMPNVTDDYGNAINPSPTVVTFTIPGHIRGTVFDAGGAPRAGVTVLVEDGAGVYVARLITDAAGRYDAPVASGQTYWVSFAPPRGAGLAFQYYSGQLSRMTAAPATLGSGDASWTFTGSMATARIAHSVTLLRNGKVLAAGGTTPSAPTATAELYDPAIGNWSATGNMSDARSSLRNGVLLSNGKVLMAGGDGVSGMLASAELYDPATGVWTRTGYMVGARSAHTTTVLQNGKVLVAGGRDPYSRLLSAELYDPVSGTWSATGGMSYQRSSHTATLLPNGKVLVVGGEDSWGTAQATAELYDPVTGIWTLTGSMTTGRKFIEQSPLLSNGKVLVAGGSPSFGPTVYSSAELYDIATGTWSATGGMGEGRYSHTMVVLPTGKVLAIGGVNGSTNLSTAELYDPGTGTWSPTARLGSGRAAFGDAPVLANGKVLVAAGQPLLASAELYTPSSPADVNGIDAHLVVGYPVTGTVTDNAGRPRPNVNVEAFHAGTVGGVCCSLVRPDSTEVTDAGGHFLLELAGSSPSDTYKIRFAGGTPQEVWFNGHYNPGNDVRVGWNAADPIAVVNPFNVCDYGTPFTELLNNSNFSGVDNGGSPTPFNVRGDYCVQQMITYHWNNGNINGAGFLGTIGIQAPGCIGACLGPWQAVDGFRTDGRHNVDWIANVPPGIQAVLRPGNTYYCIDSDPSTWSKNAETLYFGFCRVYGVAYHEGTNYGRSGVDAQLNVTPTGSLTVHVENGSHIAQSGIPVDAEDVVTHELLSGSTVNGDVTLAGQNGHSYKVHARPAPSLGYVQQWYQGKSSFDAADPVSVSGTTAITMTLDTGVAISGVVTDEAGAGVLGASVNVYRGPREATVRESGVQTGEGGRFTVIVHGGMTYFVRVDGPATASLVPQWYNNQPTLGDATPLGIGETSITLETIKLVAGVAVTGTVTGSGPLANVSVAAYDGFAASPVRIAPGVATQADGTYRLIVPKNRSLKFQFVPQAPPPDTHLPTWAPNAAAFEDAAIFTIGDVDPAPILIDLPTGVALTGFVRDSVLATGIGGAFVNANAPTGVCCKLLYQAQTNSDGYFTLVVAPNASYKINTNVAPTATPYLAQFYDNKGGDFDTATAVVVGATGFGLNPIKLVKGVRLSGTVANVLGAPLTGISVQIYGTGGCCGAQLGQKTTSNGTFATTIPAGTDFKVSFTSTGSLIYAAQWNGGTPDYNVAPALTATAGTSLTVNAMMANGFVVSGTITDRVSLQPVVGGPIRISSAGMGGSQGAVVQRAFGDSAGHYRLVVAGGAPYKLWFRSPQTPQYVEQHWNNKPTWATADAFTVTADDNTKNAQLDAVEASATASCTLPLVSPNPILLPGGAVDVFTGTTLFKSFVADAAASFQLFGLAPSTSYLLRYKGTVSNKIVECYAPATTAANGTATVGPSAPNYQNHLWGTALRLTSGQVIHGHVVRPFGAVWYKLAIAPQQQVRIDLTGLPADYTLAVYRDLVQVTKALKAQAQQGTLAAVKAGSQGATSADNVDSDNVDSDNVDSDNVDSDNVDSDNVDSDNVDSDNVDSDNVDSDNVDSDNVDSGNVHFDNVDSDNVDSAGHLGRLDVPLPIYNSVQRRGIRAYSAHKATAPESVTLNTRGLTGDLYIRVRGSHGAFDAARDFTLVAQRTVDTFCVGATFTPHAPTTIGASLANAKKSLMLTNTAALGLGETPVLDVTTLTLAAPLLANSTTLVVSESVPAWSQTGWLAIDSEIVHYAGHDGLTKTFVLDARGDLGTQPATHLLAASVAKRSLSKAEFMGMLQAIALRDDVQGYVFDIATDAGIQAAFTDLSSTRQCVGQQNLVTESIRKLITSFRTTNAIEYLVIVGGDRAIPYRRIPDRAEIARESKYNPPVDGASISDSTLVGDWFLTDDYYATANAIVRFDHELYVPDLASGRLVESAEDIVAYLRAFTQLGGSAHPTTALSSGYDFNADLAQYINTQLGTNNGVTVDSLVSVPASPPGVTGPLFKAVADPLWTAADMRTKLFGPTRYGIYSLMGHFQANRLVPADNGTGISSLEVARSSDGRFMGALVQSIGCHSGYNIVDGDAIQGLTQPVAFPEAFVSRGATLVGGTGYQYGETELLKNTELLLAKLTQELGYNEDTSLTPVGPNGMPIGKALRAAKASYVSELASYRGLDDKIIGVSTIYGMPQMRFALPSTIARPRPADVVPTPSATTGLSTALASQTYTAGATPGGTGLDQTFGLTAHGGYYDAGTATDTSVEPYRPIRPRSLTSIRADGALARGAVFLGGTYTDLPGFTPTLSVPTTENAGRAPTYVTPVFLPVRPFKLNDTGAETLVVTPFQYRAPTATDRTGRLYSAVREKVYYSSRTGTAALAGPPDIRSVVLTQNDGGMIVVTVTLATANDPGIARLDASAPEREVYATYTGDTGPYHGTWASVRMIEAASSPLTPTSSLNTYTATIDPQGNAAALRLMIQAVSGVGDVAIASDNGSFFRFVAPPPAPPPVQGPPPPPVDARPNTTLALVAPTQAMYGTSFGVTATLRTTETPPAPLGGQNVELSFGGTTLTIVTGPDGVANATFQVGVTPRPSPTYPITAAFAENATAHGSNAAGEVQVGQSSSLFVSQTPPSGLTYGDSAAVATLQAPGATQPLLLGEQPVTIAIATASRRTSAVTDARGVVRFDTADFAGLAPGTYQVNVHFAGNAFYVGSDIVFPLAVIDLRPPTVTTSATSGGQPYVAGTWTTQAVTVSFTCTSPTAVASCPAPVTLGGDGDSQWVNGIATDTHGNATPGSFGPIRIDHTAPTISAATSTPANGNGWNNTPVTVTFTCADATSGVASCTAPIPLSADGAAQPASGTATDNAGNAAGAGATVSIDRTPPTIAPSASTPSGAYTPGTWTNQTVTVHFACDDALSGLASCTADAVLAADGDSQSASGTATDKAGNSLGATFAGIRIDKTAPSITTTVTTADGKPYVTGTWTNQTVTVHFTCTDTLSGISGTTGCPADVVRATDGDNQSATGTTTDNAGNGSTAAVNNIKIDKTSPTITAAATTSDGKNYIAGTWTNKVVTVHFTCNDSLSGIAASGCPGDVVLDKQGDNQSASGTARDQAGNTASATFSPVRIDLTPPAITTMVTTADGAAYTTGTWTNQTVTVTFTCANALAATTCPVPVVLAADGENQSATGTANDVAGNTATATVSNINIDKTAPTIAATAKTADGITYTPNTWTNQKVTVHFDCADTLSKIATCPADATFGQGDNQVAAGTATDRAGNAASATFTGIRVDLTAPTISASATKLSGAPYTTGTWSSEKVVVHFTCADALSGVASCPADITLTDGDHQSASGTATDNAGNRTSVTVSDIRVDTTPPAVTYTGNTSPYTVDQTVAITCAAADTLSGLVATTCANITGPAYTFPLGGKTYSATGTDAAGNVGTGSTTVTVKVTPAGLTTLTYRFVQTSAKYQALTTQQKAAVDQLVTAVVKTLPADLSNLTPAQKAAVIAAYQRGVQSLVPLGWLTQAQADTLKTLAAGL